MEHRQTLQEQLRQENEPAMALHLAVVLLFQRHTGCMIHAPGKCVPQIVSFLSEHLSPEDHVRIVNYQSLVVRQLTKMQGAAGTSMADDESPVGDGEKSIMVLLEEELGRIKELALNNKKGNVVKNDD